MLRGCYDGQKCEAIFCEMYANLFSFFSLALIPWPTPSFFLTFGVRAASSVFYVLELSAELRLQAPDRVDPGSGVRAGFTWEARRPVVEGTGGELSRPGFSFLSHTLQSAGPCLPLWNGYTVKNVPHGLSWHLNKTEQLNSLTLLSGNVSWKRMSPCFQKVVTLIPLLSSSRTIRDGARVVFVITNMYWGLLWDEHCARCWGVQR